MHRKTIGNVCRHTVKVGSFTEFPVSQGLLRAGDFRGCPQGQAAPNHPSTPTREQGTWGSPSHQAPPWARHRLICPLATFRRSPQEQRALWALPSPFPPFLSKWLGQSLTAALQAGKPTLRKHCRKCFRWEEVGWKTSLSGFYYQVLLSQPLHVAESLCSSSSAGLKKLPEDLRQAKRPSMSCSLQS